MLRVARLLLLLLVLVLGLGVANAQGQASAPSLQAANGCAEVRYSEVTGQPTSLKWCGQVDPAGDPEAVARAALSARAKTLGVSASNGELTFTQAQKANGVTHVRFDQTHKGVPVYLGHVLVQYDVAGEVQLILNKTVPKLDVDVTPKLDADTALKQAQAQVPNADKQRAKTRRDLVIYADRVSPTLAWRIRIYTASPPGDWNVMVSAVDGKVLAVWDEIRDEKKPAPKPADPIKRGAVITPLDPLAETSSSDARALKGQAPTSLAATGSALTYNPNAVHQTGDVNLRDNNDANSPALEAARVNVPLNNLDDNTGKLKGRHVDVTASGITGCSLPYTPGQANEPNRVYNYTRDDDRFEEALTYAAIDGVQTWFQSLGFNNVNNRSQPVNVHCIPEDNSFYSDDDKALHFGDGGVDDAEDADVVIHEYGHAVQDNQAPDWGPGQDTEQRAMGEGFGDFLPGMYYINQGSPAFLDRYKYCIMEWDATSYNPVDPDNPGSGCLRWINGRDEISGNDIGAYSGEPEEEHDDGRYWSAALTCVYEGMGANLTARDNIMRILLQSHFSIVPDSSDEAFEDAVDALLLADRNLLGGANQRLIIGCMAERGLIDLPSLPAPVLTFPVGGEALPLNAPVTVTWQPNGAPAEATYTVEYTNMCVPPGDFFDNVESGVNGWTVSHTGGTNDWRIVTGEAHSPVASWFAPSLNAVSQLNLVSRAFTVSDSSQLIFWHRYNMEAGSGDTGYDGGVVEISTDNGATWTDLGAQMTQNGYNRTISSDFGSPLAGRRAFSGSNTTWIETRATLNSYVGQTVRLRFTHATDSSVARDGWWVDDILVGQPFTQTWTPIGTTAAGATSLTWTTPNQPGVNYCIRIYGEAEGYTRSPFAVSRPFGVGQTPPTVTVTPTGQPGGTSTPTVTRTSVPSTITPTPTGQVPARTPTPTVTLVPPVTVTPTVTPQTPPGSACMYISTVKLYQMHSDGRYYQMNGSELPSFSVDATHRRGDTLIGRYPAVPFGGQGEFTWATLDLRTFWLNLQDARSYLRLNVPNGYSFKKAECTDIMGRACVLPTSGQSSTTNAVQLDFACNAGVEYRFYVARDGAYPPPLSQPPGRGANPAATEAEGAYPAPATR